MKKLLHWRIVYAVGCLVYAGWMIAVGGNEFDRINSQYRRLVAGLDADRVRAAALEELAAECRREAKAGTGRVENGCAAWSTAAVAARAQTIADRRKQARERGLVKLVLFYTGFVVIFLLAPIILIYLLIVAIIALYRNVRFVR